MASDFECGERHADESGTFAATAKSCFCGGE
jgi:hypothetical protein